jgi:hypothetical protein
MNDDNIVVLVDFDEPGLQQTSLISFKPEQVQKSKESIENALEVIKWVADKAKKALDAAHEKPDQAELEFGIKVGSKAGILVAEGSAEFHIKATLIWKNTD